MASTQQSFNQAFAAWQNALAEYEEAAEQAKAARKTRAGPELMPFVDLVKVRGLDLEHAHSTLVEALRREGPAGSTAAAEP